MGGPQSTATQPHQLPWVFGATLAVVGLPMVMVSLLRGFGVLTSTPLLIAAGMLMSIVASQAGAACWAASRHAGDMVFGDLMLWGWLRRRRSDRQIASAPALFAPPAATPNGMEVESVDVRRRQRMLQQLATSLESRDPATQGHSRRVARHAAAIAKRMGLPPDQVARIRAGAALHDVGKISTPISLLNKPGKLTDDEFAIIQQHAEIGAEAVSSLEDAELVGIVRHHHERIDGRGYPHGLRGEEIPIGARIVAVADTFDAVTSPRPYRDAKRHRDALLLLDSVAGTQLDPDAVRAFRRYYGGLRSLAFWAFALNGPRQAIASVLDQVKLGGLQLPGAATAATMAAVVAGGVAIHSATPASAGDGSPPAHSSSAAISASADLAVAPAGKASSGDKIGSTKPGAHHRADVQAAAAAARHRSGGSSHPGGAAGGNATPTSAAGSNSSASADSSSSAADGSSGGSHPAHHASRPSHSGGGHEGGPVSHAVSGATRHSVVHSAANTVGSATSAIHAAVPDVPAAPTVTVPEQAEAIGLKTKVTVDDSLE